MHFKRDVDTGGRALRSSGAEVGQGLSDAGDRTGMRSGESGRINGRYKTELYQRDEKGSNFSGDLVPIALFLRWLSTAARREH